jgi:hypothetical protein
MAVSEISRHQGGPLAAWLAMIERQRQAHAQSPVRVPSVPRRVEGPAPSSRAPKTR